jgi:hypothetical protein
VWFYRVGGVSVCFFAARVSLVAGASWGVLVCEAPAQILSRNSTAQRCRAPLSQVSPPASNRKCYYKAQELVATPALYKPARQRLHFGVALEIRHDVGRLLAA